jgi:hypothetical protein
MADISQKQQQEADGLAKKKLKHNLDTSFPGPTQHFYLSPEACYRNIPIWRVLPSADPHMADISIQNQQQEAERVSDCKTAQAQVPHAAGSSSHMRPHDCATKPPHAPT